MNPLEIAPISTVPLQSDPGGAFGTLILLIMFVIFLIIPAAGMWKTFTKAGKPGWGAFIPILNFLYLLDIADKPTWWVILMFLPVIHVIVGIIVTIDVAKNFDKGAGFGIGLVLLPFVFWPLLGFGDAHYVGDTSSGI